jgi:hypothetical protein
MPALDELTQELVARKQLPPVPMRRALRQAAGASLERTAEAVGDVTHEAVRTWELGKREPRGRNAIAYGAVLRRFAELAAHTPDTREPGSFPGSMGSRDDDREQVTAQP